MLPHFKRITGVYSLVGVLIVGLQECAGVFRSMQKHAEVCRDMQQWAEMCRSVQKGAGVGRSMQEFFKILIQIFTKIFIIARSQLLWLRALQQLLPNN